MPNALYYGGILDVLRFSVGSARVSLTYLGPPLKAKLTAIKRQKATTPVPLSCDDEP